MSSARLGFAASAFVAVCAFAGPVRAQQIELTGPLAGPPPPPDVEYRALGTVELSAGYARALGPRGAAPSDVGGAGLAARVFFGGAIAAGAGFEFDLGALSSPKDGGAFAGSLVAFPLGVAVLPSNDAVIAVLPGVGFDGATAGEPGALVLPIELRLAFDVCRRVRVTADARPTWLPTEPLRQNGSIHFRWTDEISGRLALRWGRKWEDAHGHHRSEGQTSGGYFLRAELAERMQTTYVGASIGYELVGGAIFHRWPPW